MFVDSLDNYILHFQFLVAAFQWKDVLTPKVRRSIGDIWSHVKR